MSEIRKVQRGSMADQVVKNIREAITSGQWSIGDRLPNEQELAKQLGVGRSSVREGIRILAGYGLVETRQGEGTFVVDNQAEQIFDLFGYRSDAENIRYLNQLRHMLETGCISIIFDVGLQSEQLACLHGLVEDLDKAQNSASAIQADSAFHKTLFSYTQNPLLIQIYAMISKLLHTLMLQLMCRQDVLDDARHSHRKIYDALAAGDRTACLTAMSEHLENVDNYTIRYIDQ